MKDYEQAEHLERVTARIGVAIREFFRNSTVADFHADDLRRYVTGRCGVVAPASADRVLRELRKQNLLNYVVISRKQSLYRIVPTNAQMTLLDLKTMEKTTKEKPPKWIELPLPIDYGKLQAAYMAAGWKWGICESRAFPTADGLREVVEDLLSGQHLGTGGLRRNHGGPIEADRRIAIPYLQAMQAPSA